MKKRFAAIIVAVVLTLSFAVSALAAPYGRGGGYCGGGYSLMWDADGNFLDKTAFEDNLDSLIESGVIKEADRGAFLDQYDWCVNYGAGATGVRGGGCGGGRGMGCTMYR